MSSKKKDERKDLISESAVKLAENLDSFITGRTSRLDPDGYTVHDEFEIEITKGSLVITVNTGWKCGWTVKKAGNASLLKAGDCLCASDWMVDNYGPEGISLQYNDTVFVVNYHDEPEVKNKKVQSQAKQFADNLCETLKADSFLDLAEACWLLTKAGDAGLWRLRSTARVTLNPSDARSFSDRT